MASKRIFHINPPKIADSMASFAFQGSCPASPAKKRPLLCLPTRMSSGRDSAQQSDLLFVEQAVPGLDYPPPMKAMSGDADGHG